LAVDGAAVGGSGVGPDVVADRLAVAGDADLRARGEVAVGAAALLRAGLVVRRLLLDRAVVEHEPAVVVGEPGVLTGPLAEALVAAELLGDVRRVGVLGQQRQVGHLPQQAFERDLARGGGGGGAQGQRQDGRQDGAGHRRLLHTRTRAERRLY